MSQKLKIKMFYHCMFIVAGGLRVGRPPSEVFEVISYYASRKVTEMFIDGVNEGSCTYDISVHLGEDM
jgi:hypothetical protein